MPKRAPEIDIETDTSDQQEEEHKTVTRLKPALTTVKEAKRLLNQIEHRVRRGGDRVTLLMEPVPGDGNGTPDSIRFTARY
jgi:hypothetical protein